MLLTAKLMLDWLKETEMAKRLEAAIARVIAEGKVCTYDMSGRRGDTDSSGGEGGKASTLDVAKVMSIKVLQVCANCPYCARRG
jgi:isocitrate/isopropylmalate dehydrogenase